MRSNNIKSLLVLVLLVVLFFGVKKMVDTTHAGAEEIDFSEFLRKVDQGQIASVTVKGNDYQGKYADQKEFETHGPTVLDSQLIEKMTKANVKAKYEKEDGSSFWFQVLVQGLLPIALIGLLFFFLMRQMQAGGGRAMSFGKSRAKLLNENANKITFANVAGIDEAKGELEEIVEFLKDPKRFTRLGGRIPKGVLLMGPPGTGKTLLARAIAGEAGVPFFTISGSDFVEMFVGVGASRVRDLFEQAKKQSPCIIFIDEIDAVGRHRGSGLGGGHDEREQTLNQLLVEMDGFEANEGVILIAATNRIDVLDPALLRPGRFDRRIVVPLPDLKGRTGILAVHTRKVPLEGTVELERIARGTPGFSGADLENLVNEAALLAARHGQEKVRIADFEEAKDKVIMGVERRSMIISEKERRITAVHEAGHTLVAKVLPNMDPVHKVTVIPRGPALGLTMQLPVEDRHSYSREDLKKMIAMMMGGRLAEELVLGEMTNGASNDIERATDIARRMVCEWGMSDKLGPLAFGKREAEIFLGREISRSESYSAETAMRIDAEVHAIVMTEYARAKQVLSEHRATLDRLADALVTYETLDGEEIDKLMAGETLNKEKPAPPALPPPSAKGEQEKKEKKRILDALDGLTPVPEPDKAAG